MTSPHMTSPHMTAPHAIATRQPDHPIERLFVDRWSPRAYDAAPMPVADLMTILEAGRWAPSAYNLQPWRFVYALRDDAAWPSFVGLLDPFNAAWAANASALVVLLSDTAMPDADGRPTKVSAVHGFDAGAAWAQVALQATALGYQAHAMAGIDFDGARRTLGVPDRYRVQIAIAIGRRAAAETLPEPLKAREFASGRMPLAEIAFRGVFPGAPSADGARP